MLRRGLRLADGVEPAERPVPLGAGDLVGVHVLAVRHDQQLARAVLVPVEVAAPVALKVACISISNCASNLLRHISWFHRLATYLNKLINQRGEGYSSCY